MHELRRDPRYACHLPAVFDGPRGAVRGVCTNVSVGGLFFEGSQLALGSSTSVTLELTTGQRLKLGCQVRHHGPRGMGVQFTRLEPGQAELLQGLVASLAR